MDCPRCGAAMQPTYEPYERYCAACHYLYDFYVGKEINVIRTLTAYEQLQLENQRLREALKPFVDFYEQDKAASNPGRIDYTLPWPGQDSLKEAFDAFHFNAIAVTTDVSGAPPVPEKPIEPSAFQQQFTVRENGRLSFLKRVEEDDPSYGRLLLKEDFELLRKIAQLFGY